MYLLSSDSFKDAPNALSWCIFVVSRVLGYWVIASGSDITIRQQIDSTEFDDNLFPLISIAIRVREGSVGAEYHEDCYDYLDSRMNVTECPASISAYSYGTIGYILDSHSQCDLESKAVEATDASAKLFVARILAYLSRTLGKLTESMSSLFRVVRRSTYVRYLVLSRSTEH